MAGNLAFFNAEDFSAGPVYAIGSATNVTSVEFDGYYFWITNDTSILQCVITDAGAISIESTITLTGGLISGFSTTTGICTDGLDLWLSYIGVGGFPLAAYNEIIKLDKQGNVLTTLTSSTRPSGTLGPYRDITYIGDSQGMKIAASRLQSGLPSLAALDIFDILEDDLSETFTSAVRDTANGLTYDGLDFIVARTDTGAPLSKFDMQYTQTATQVSTGLTTIDGLCVSKDLQTLKYDHKWIAAVYN